MKLFAITLVCLASFGSIQAQEVTFEDLNRASQKFMTGENPEAVLRGSLTLLSKEMQPIGHIFQFAPSGFVIASTSKSTRPIYAYSVTNDFLLSKEDASKAKAIFSQDLINRIQFSDQLPFSQKTAIAREWEQFLDGRLLMTPVQQWPPEGSTPSGGWIETDWTQSAPFSKISITHLPAGLSLVRVSFEGEQILAGKIIKN